MTWAFVNRGANAPIQSRPRWTESLHGDSVGVVALKTCCRHTSVGQELGRLVPGRGRYGGLRPPMIQVTVPSGSSAVLVALGTYEVRAPSPCLEWDDRVIPIRMAMGATISTVPCWRTCRLVRRNGT